MSSAFLTLRNSNMKSYMAISSPRISAGVIKTILSFFNFFVGWVGGRKAQRPSK